MRSPLNRTSAPQCVRLFDYCFKRGVLDAMEVGDDYLVKDWYDARLADFQFGELSNLEEIYDWRHWRFVLYRWCRNAAIGTVGTTYIDSIRNKNNYLWVVLPMAMRFYLMGVGEWLEYPNLAQIDIFKQTRYVHWKRVPQHLRNIKLDDYISYVQEFVFERQKAPEEIKKGFPSDAAYDNFAQAIWALTRRYAVRYRKAKDEDN